VSDRALIALAEAAGLLPRWRDAAGATKVVSADVLKSLLYALGFAAATLGDVRDSQARLQAQGEAIPPMLTAEVGREAQLVGQGRGPIARLTLESGETQDIRLTPTLEGSSFLAPQTPGYHRLEVDDRQIRLAVAPIRACVLADRIEGDRAWGSAVQVYSLRGEGRSRASDFGDFGDLAAFARAIGARGAQALAISPVHALFAADPSRSSPYAPSSRLFLNSLYADPGAVAGSDPPPPSPQKHLIDWADAGPAKLARLRDAYQRLKTHGGDALNAFHAFRREGGRDLERHARFEALHAHFFSQTGARGWQDWPSAFHDPESLAVSAFVREQAEEVTFHAFLQGLADTGLAKAQAAARDAGMGVGLIADLAVGLDAGGSQAWSRPDDLLRGVSVGAPPDIFQPSGQDWGVAALSPNALRDTGYDAYLKTLRRAFRHAGGVRIDHAMGLRRLWLTPHGASPADGAYLTYPFEDLLRLIALESYRAKAIVIGEDLGTVPDGFREALHGAGALGMSVLWFERDAGGEAFTAPASWSPKAAALTTTHDLPTIAGWWSGRDIDWQARLGDPASNLETARAVRDQDRAHLWSAYLASGVATGDAPPSGSPSAAVDAAVAYVAAAACPLAIVPVEDLIGLEEQPNRPGTVDEHPNWRRRLPAAADELFDAPAVSARATALSQARPGRARPQ
jgi:4-alpha-glucanotransferase